MDLGASLVRGHDCASIAFARPRFFYCKSPTFPTSPGQLFEMNKTEFNQSRYTPDVAATTRPPVTPAGAQRQTFLVTPHRPSTSPLVRRVSRHNPDGCRTRRSITSSDNDHNDCRPLFENVARKLFSEPEPRSTTSPPAVQHMSNLRRAVSTILFLALALIFPKLAGLFIDMLVAVDYHWIEL